MSEHSLKYIKAVFMDWAGTMIDYGCFSPIDIFIEIFLTKEIEITREEARKPMGYPKRDHIEEICKMERIENLWKDKYRKFPDTTDIDDLYSHFETDLLSILPKYCTLIPGAAEISQRLQNMGIKIGSTTGFTREMIDIVIPHAKKQGYTPDSVVTSDEVPSGRPRPWMIYHNAINLDAYPLKHTVKVGDTLNDIYEGQNAGTWTVGIIKGSSELGMTEEDVNQCDSLSLEIKMETVSQQFKDAGADYVIENIGQLEEVLSNIDHRISMIENPSIRAE
ncbi:phosphonoacetaldehyde hydrolase [Natribacillus halophilus]|uniref:Phosphonoacetaldehyde hydrolase n=1 Tax=Natribacillus halophilus TaxID=549003 RepID=A0A1G8KBL4_9BACI|nr:phosphonoacetaldehyde hydrolase [Natribacillus halophilus]SDI40749.1 phosphonoacetaldehyde hydrolase [Natribacillus halophilus]